MLRRIVVALDGSDLAESALPYAENLARLSGGTLVLVDVVASGETLESFDTENPGVFRPIVTVPSPEDDLLIVREVMTEARDYLDTLARDQVQRGLKVETVVVAGDAAETLIEEATLRHADLIVMSTHGRSGLGRWLYGSVAESVIELTPVPVLLVRSGLPWRGSPPPGSKVRLLVPLDGSPIAENALGVATDLARVLDAEVFLVRIVPSAPASMTGETLRFGGTEPRHASDSYERDAESYLETIATRLREEGLTVATAVADDDPPAGILAAAEATGAAMIVMATHGRTGLGRAILGSVALDLVRQGTRPVLLVRPTSEPAARPSDAVTAK
jgi:nucleotide-binding universal stress UspA family protein